MAFVKTFLTCCSVRYPQVITLIYIRIHFDQKKKKDFLSFLDFVHLGLKLALVGRLESETEVNLGWFGFILLEIVFHRAQRGTKTKDRGIFPPPNQVTQCMHALCADTHKSVRHLVNQPHVLVL